MILAADTDSYRDLFSPTDVWIGGLSFVFEKNCITIPAFQFADELIQRAFVGYVLIRKELTVKRLPVFETCIESELYFRLFLKWFVRKKKHKSVYIRAFDHCFLAGPEVNRRKEIPDLMKGLLVQHKDRYRQEKKEIKLLTHKKDRIRKQIEAIKQKQIEERDIWNDAQAQIAILKEEINDIKSAALEFAEDRKIMKEKIRQKKNDIQFLRSHRPKKDREKIQQFRQALKDLEKTYNPLELYAGIEETFRSTFFRQNLLYGDSEFPLVYDFRYDREILRREEHSVSDYEEANKLHDRVVYWKAVFQKAFRLQYNTYNVRGLKRGKLDRFKLHKQFNLFKRVDRIIKKTHAIFVLISANTDEAGIQAGRDFSYVLAEAVKPLKVSVEVVVFRSDEIPVEIDDNWRKKYARFSHNMEYEILKEFGDRNVDQILRKVRPCLVSYDHEALKYAGNKLVERKEKYKWLVYFSGGHPDLKLLPITGIVLKEIEDAGIKIVGIGTGSSWIKSVLPGGVLLDYDVNDGMNFFLRHLMQA